LTDDGIMDGGIMDDGIMDDGAADFEPTSDDATNSVPPEASFGPPPGRNPENNGPPPLANLQHPNDLPPRGGPK
jgi:hypothetical protein